MSPKLGAPRRVTCLVSFTALAFALLGAVALAATETPGETFVGSTSASGEMAESGVGPHASISADGNLLAFVSQSANLDPEATKWDQAYVKDLDSGAVALASRADGAAGPPADATVEAAILSADGRYLVFQSAAENLVAGLPPGPAAHVYRRDLGSGETTLVDRADGSGGEVVPLAASVLAVSADGNLVAFADFAQELEDPAGGHGTGEATIYVRDLATGTTIRVAAEGAEEAAFSADGRYLLFTSPSPALPEASGTYEVYRRDLRTGATLLVSRGNPTEAAPEGEPADGESYEAVFVGSSDCEAAFLGAGSTNLTPGPHPPLGVYVRDFCASAPTTTLVSIDEEGNPFETAIAPSTTTGGEVAFVAQDVPFEPALLYVRDPAAGTTALLARGSGEGEPANHEAVDGQSALIAAGGCRAIFTTVATNLIGDEEAALPGSETFVRQLAPCRLAPPDEGANGTGSEAGPDPAPGVGAGGVSPGTAAPSAIDPGPARSVGVAGLGRRAMLLAFDGPGRARVRVQRQARGGGWKQVGSRFVDAAAAGVLRVGLPRLGEGRYRIKLRLQGDPDNPTLTRRIGGAESTD